MVGDDIVIEVLSIRGHQVRLGIQAPKDTPIHREEIYNRIQKEKQSEFNAEADADREPGERPGDPIHKQRDTGDDVFGGYV